MNNTATYIQKFIRQHGEYKSVAIGILALLLLVIGLTIIFQLLFSKTIALNPIYYPAIIAILVGPIILHRFVRLISQLDRSEDKLSALSIMDDLTDVYNRRFFIEQAEKELAKVQRYGTNFSILALDVDHLKNINSKYGHSAGDMVLQTLANTCMNNLRTMDIFARYDAEEFAFLIPESDKIDVIAFAEKVLDAIDHTIVVFNRREIRFTVSMGVKTFDASASNLDMMLNEVDEAVYEAKRRGRNCIVVCDTEKTSAAGQEAVL